MQNDDLRRQLPHGLADLFFEQAAAKARVEQLLEGTFARWGYGRIILPTLGYHESLITGASPNMREEMYRLVDRDGQILALRPDLTVPTARVVGTRLYDQPLPMRFFYVGNVFRYEEPQAGRRREFTQAGIELVGADTPEADAEVLSVAIAALQALGVQRFQINLGQVEYLKAVLSATALANGELDRLEAAIGRKNDVEIAQVLRELGIEAETAQVVQAVPHLCGGADILDEAARLAPNEAARAAVARLQTVHALLRDGGLAEHVVLDLGEVRSMAYYTGITFQGFVEGLGFSVCRGGRYDNLIANFGSDLPAVGFALGVERAMLVSQQAVDLGPDLLLPSGAGPDLLALATRARGLGQRVEVDVLGREGQALLDYGHMRGAHRIVLPLDGGRYRLLEGASERVIGRQALWEEMASWTS
jgi:ATP phosphoribosyltransferase regulatory subunit